MSQTELRLTPHLPDLAADSAAILITAPLSTAATMATKRNIMLPILEALRPTGLRLILPGNARSRTPGSPGDSRMHIARLFMLANTILLIHFALVLFITAGLPLIYVGGALGWTWVRAWRWRALHLSAIVLVAVESLLGIACPLTVWENALRGNRSNLGFVERWIERIMFYDLPAWVFIIAYTGFAVLVAMTWVAVPPTRIGGMHAPEDKRNP